MFRIEFSKPEKEKKMADLPNSNQAMTEQGHLVKKLLVTVALSNFEQASSLKDELYHLTLSGPNRDQDATLKRNIYDSLIQPYQTFCNETLQLAKITHSTDEINQIVKNSKSLLQDLKNKIAVLQKTPESNNKNLFFTLASNQKVESITLQLEPGAIVSLKPISTSTEMQAPLYNQQKPKVKPSISTPVDTQSKQTMKPATQVSLYNVHKPKK
jgi:hypothetical protein